MNLQHKQVDSAHRHFLAEQVIIRVRLSSRFGVISKRLVAVNVADRCIKATFAPRPPGCKALFDARLKRAAGPNPSGVTCL